MNFSDVSSKTISAGIGVGIGMGVAVGVAVVGAMIWLRWRRRERDTLVGGVGVGWDRVLLWRGMRKRRSRGWITRMVDGCLESWMGRGV